MSARPAFEDILFEFEHIFAGGPGAEPLGAVEGRARGKPALTRVALAPEPRKDAPATMTAWLFTCESAE
ncbi:hypothetical protein [Streptomyces sp. NPDC002855]|uniref:hypothetical protein n=1 Tax=Streptomyces sp. NPDC002855 TaxID=3154437 RepID=UPI0033286CB0